LQAIEGVEVVADVPDVRPYLAEAALAVCPIRVARGLQNKVLEAMAMERATLAAPAAIRAIRAEVGKDLLSPTTEAEWIAAVCDLLPDASRQRELGLAARQFVEEHHHWERCLQPLVGALLAATRRQVPA
jgi:polysaccharide biosynthesis protein PslH